MAVIPQNVLYLLLVDSWMVAYLLANSSRNLRVPILFTSITELFGFGAIPRGSEWSLRLSTILRILGFRSICLSLWCLSLCVLCLYLCVLRFSLLSEFISFDFVSPLLSMSFLFTKPNIQDIQSLFLLRNHTVINFVFVEPWIFTSKCTQMVKTIWIKIKSLSAFVQANLESAIGELFNGHSMQTEMTKIQTFSEIVQACKIQDW